MRGVRQFPISVFLRKDLKLFAVLVRTRGNPDGRSILWGGGWWLCSVCLNLNLLM
jgi:hypothetical protein